MYYSKSILTPSPLLQTLITDDRMWAQESCRRNVFRAAAAAYARQNVMVSFITQWVLWTRRNARTRSPCARITSGSTKRFMIKLSLEGCTLILIRWMLFWFLSTQYKPNFPWRQTKFIILSQYGSSHKTERKLVILPVIYVSSTNDEHLFCGSYTEVNDQWKYNLHVYCRKNVISQLKNILTMRLEWGGRKEPKPTPRQRADSCLDQTGLFMNRLRNRCAVQNRHLKISVTTGILGHKADRHNLCFKTSLHVRIFRGFIC